MAKHGAVFTLDAIFAFLLLTAFIVAGVSHTEIHSSIREEALQMGGQVTHILLEEKLHSLNTTALEIRMEELLPSAYKMHVVFTINGIVVEASKSDARNDRVQGRYTTRRYWDGKVQSIVVQYEVSFP